MTVAEMEKERISSLASEYLRNGYDVIIDPSVHELPPFLASFTPDIVARSSHGNVVVEVKSTRDFDADDIKRLADAVAAHPGWKFEVVLANPPVAPDVPPQEELVGSAQVERLLQNAELLAKQGQHDAASLLAWSAVEAILRRHARVVAPEVERQSSARVLKHFYGLGFVHEEIYERLSELMRYRNAVAHGFSPSHTPPDIAIVVADIRRLKNAA
jgi:hypothetical protein